MLNHFIHYYHQVERFFGNVKFAVVIILIFAGALTYGTFMESYHGTEYANRLVYKSIPFMMVQACMFLSILCASLLRLPIRKGMHGFHMLHVGLMIIFLGSFITYQVGVDGNITLAPNTPVRDIILSDDILRVEFQNAKKEVTVDLPFTAFEKNLNLEYEGIKFLRFLPFAEDSVQWVEDKMGDTTRIHSSIYRLANENFGEDLTLSLHPDADFPSTTTLGLLSVHYMPTALKECFSKPSFEGLLVWDARDGVCLNPTLKDIKANKSVTGKKSITLNYKDEQILFLPDLSPLPVTKDFKVDENSPYRIFKRKLFQDKPHLFLFGKSAAWFDKAEQTWKTEDFKEDAPIALPWMGFGITLTKFYPYQYPVKVPEYVKPIQDNGQIIKGNKKAVEVEVDGVRFWVKTGQAMSFNRGNEKLAIEVSKRTLPLPFELTLERFKMDTDPGTNNPASYESFISLFKGDAGSEKHHVYMNHPMKHDAFTFYQASYFQSQEGPYGSVLSVNYDPGRPWKYLGSLLLVFGSIWHFVLRGKKTSPSKAKA